MGRFSCYFYPLTSVIKWVITQTDFFSELDLFLFANITPKALFERSIRKLIQANFHIIATFVIGRDTFEAGLNTTHWYKGVIAQLRSPVGIRRLWLRYHYITQLTSESQFCASEGYIILIPRNGCHISLQNKAGYGIDVVVFRIT